LICRRYKPVIQPAIARYLALLLLCWTVGRVAVCLPETAAGSSSSGAPRHVEAGSFPLIAAPSGVRSFVTPAHRAERTEIAHGCAFVFALTSGCWLEHGDAQPLLSDGSLRPPRSRGPPLSTL
jgi:hypothetical protein